MINRPCFAPHCSPLILGPEQVAIVTELEHYFVTNPLARRVVSLINGKRSTDEIVDELAPYHEASHVYFQILALARQGFIEETNGDLSGAGRFHSPEASSRAFWSLYRDEPLPDPGRKQLKVGLLSAGGADAALLADHLPETTETGFFQPTYDGGADWQGLDWHEADIWVLVTSDYLEPDLLSFNRAALEAKAAWLPVKPKGMLAWLGPLFVPEKTGCLDCLTHCLKRHQDLEAFFMEQTRAESTLRLSRASLGETLGMVGATLGLELAKLAGGDWLTEPEEDAPFEARGLLGQVLSIDFRNLEFEWHLLRKRPQCPVCGEALVPKDLSNLAGLKPLVLDPLPKSPLSEGGQRFRSPEETWRDWRKLISPITGIVPYVKPNPCDPSFLGHHFGTVMSKKDCINPNQEGRSYPVGASAGKGYTAIQARVSTVGEAVERYCGRYQGDEDLIQASYEQVADRAVHPSDLLNFSKEQYQNREQINRGSLLAYVPRPYQDHEVISWTQAWSLTEERWKLVPGGYVWFGFPLENGDRYARSNSNGLSAGSRLEEAILQGLIELIERDSVALWWANRIKKPALDLEAIPGLFVKRAIKGFAEKNRGLHVLDVSNEVGLNAFCAISAPLDDPVNRHTRFGLGCDFDYTVALKRALGELGQIWASPNQEMVGKALQELIKTPWQEKQHLLPDPKAPLKRPEDFKNLSTDDIKKDIEFLKKQLARMGVELLVKDLSQPDIPIKVARVMAPGLRHMWPRFGPGRLYDAPVKLGWLDEPRREEELFKVPFDY
ncbi:TOMM precursor leader peptide-binding protein [Dethiosulfatarculus sandiegensis]|uniref:YcaO domain-containing protein n=1 Tax=Dethiosulfatarculus sandiegensis TaxID=1429043 RepID=A0A0D2JXN0_9BACT|nr:TOMM precursor leader peptide-binding protein [Dethiosulfatarculus sandiegensis]KIX14340.1 hypothetical protein X474_08760 [Dethiosulfatarculus sandiegensis]